MNNPNNSNRVVINLDDGLDDLDDDDITLPSLPAQSVPIIDETFFKIQGHFHPSPSAAQDFN